LNNFFMLKTFGQLVNLRVLHYYEGFIF